MAGAVRVTTISFPSTNTSPGGALSFISACAAAAMPPLLGARTQEAVWRSLGDYDLRPRLRALASRFPLPPCLVVHGTFDPLPIAGSRDLAALLSAKFVELPVGHCPHVEATEEFVRALDGFLPSI